MEGACVGESLRQPAEVVHNTKDQNGKTEQETGQPGQGFRHVLGVVVPLVGLDLVDFLVHLAVNVENGVRRLKLDLDGGLRRAESDGALYRHDHLNIVSCVNAAAHHKTVDSGQHGHAPDVSGDQEME